MALPASGSISLSQVNTELGFSASAIISLNDTAVRNLAGVASGAISMQNLLGKSAFTMGFNGSAPLDAETSQGNAITDFEVAFYLNGSITVGGGDIAVIQGVIPTRWGIGGSVNAADYSARVTAARINRSLRFQGQTTTTFGATSNLDTGFVDFSATDIPTRFASGVRFFMAFGIDGNTNITLFIRNNRTGQVVQFGNANVSLTGTNNRD